MPWSKRLLPILLVTSLVALAGCQTNGNSGEEVIMPYAGWDRARDR